MTKPKWYHYLMAAGEQDPDNPNPQIYSPSERAQTYADKDNKKLQQIHSEQFELDKTLAKNKAKVAAYSLAYASNPVLASFATLGIEDLRNIYHRATQPLDSPRPASWENVRTKFNNKNASLDDKISAITDAGITTHALLSAFNPAFKYIRSGKTAKGMAQNTWDLTKKMIPAVAVSTTIGTGLGLSGMYENRPGLSEAIIQLSGYLPMLPQYYNSGINKIAQKYRTYKPTVTDTSGKTILQPKVIINDKGNGKLEYVGESYGSSVKKDLFSKLGANAPLQDNTLIEIHKDDGTTQIYDVLTKTLKNITSPKNSNLTQALLK